MSMNEDDWLRQIAATPDDDEIRLIFADWLEEHGDTARKEKKTEFDSPVERRVRADTSAGALLHWRRVTPIDGDTHE